MWARLGELKATVQGLVDEGSSSEASDGGDGGEEEDALAKLKARLKQERERQPGKADIPATTESPGKATAERKTRYMSERKRGSVDERHVDEEEASSMHATRLHQVDPAHTSDQAETQPLHDNHDRRTKEREHARKREAEGWKEKANQLDRLLVAERGRCEALRDRLDQLERRRQTYMDKQSEQEEENAKLRHQFEKEAQKLVQCKEALVEAEGRASESATTVESLRKELEEHRRKASVQPTAQGEKKLSEALGSRVKELEKRCKKLQEEKEKYQAGLQKLKAQILKREEIDETTMEAERDKVRNLTERVEELVSQEEMLLENNQKLQVENAAMKEQLQLLQSHQEQLGTDTRSLSEVLAAKEQELSNLQAALGQMAAENELYQEQGSQLMLVKRELEDTKEALSRSLADAASARSEADAARTRSIQHEQASNRALHEAHVIREESLRARYTMEETIRQLQKQLGETSSMIEKRIIVQLLLTYVKKKNSKEVLAVMAKMLDFTEEELEEVGLKKRGLHSTEGVANGGEPTESLSKMWLKFLEEEVKGQP
eukprot:scaffold786_cov329-Pavlova_lutheri.AAC.19